MLMDDLFILQMFKKQMFELQSIIKDRAPWKYCKAALAAAAASVTVAAAAAQQLQHQHSAPMQHQKQQQKQRKIEKAKGHKHFLLLFIKYRTNYLFK